MLSKKPMDKIQEWFSEINKTPSIPTPRLGWRDERVELLQKLEAAWVGLRQGLNAETALELAQTVYATTNFAAVAVNNRQETIAWASDEPTQALPHLGRRCPAIQLSLATGQFQTCRHEPQASLLSNCWVTPLEEMPDLDTTLRWLVAIPLASHKEVVGVLTVYASDLFPLNANLIELARWIASQANANLELGRLQSASAQVAEAELKALRAQISPHFLFNTLNSIAALIRIDAEQARELVVDFASFFRRTLKQHGEFVTLAEELDYVQQYVKLELMRFGGRLQVQYELAPKTETVLVPVLTVQPLIENAIQHGIAPKMGGGQVWVKTQDVSNGDIEISVEDNGVGISPEVLNRLQNESPSGNGLGMALNNINMRFQKIFGPDYQLKIESTRAVGTKVSLRVPRLRKH